MNRHYIGFNICLATALLCSGCASAKYFQGVQLPPKRMSLIRIVPVAQTPSFTCGYAAFASVALYYNVDLSSLIEGDIQRRFGNRDLSVEDISQMATTVHLGSFAYQGNYEDLMYNIKKGRPVLILLKKPLSPYSFPSFAWLLEKSSSILARPHWVVAIGSVNDNELVVIDPSRGLLSADKESIEREWDSNIAVLIFKEASQ